MTDTCGYIKDTDGKPCGRPAGWGRDANNGYCKDHIEDGRVLRKFNTETKERLLSAASVGAYKEHCAEAAGITEQTLRNWLNWGKEDEENEEETELAEFYLEWQRARGQGAIERLSNASDEWVLERSYGYHKKQEIEHSGDAGIVINVPDRDD